MTRTLRAFRPLQRGHGGKALRITDLNPFLSLGMGISPHNIQPIHENSGAGRVLISTRRLSAELAEIIRNLPGSRPRASDPLDLFEYMLEEVIGWEVCRSSTRPTPILVQLPNILRELF